MEGRSRVPCRKRRRPCTNSDFLHLPTVDEVASPKSCIGAARDAQSCGSTSEGESVATEILEEFSDTTRVEASLTSTGAACESVSDCYRQDLAGQPGLPEEAATSASALLADVGLELEDGRVSGQWRACGLCQESHCNFGSVCASCRKVGPRGSVKKCGDCDQFFQGFGNKCLDCMECSSCPACMS